MNERDRLLVSLSALLGGILPAMATGAYFVTGGPVYPGWGLWLVLMTFVLTIVGAFVGFLLTEEMAEEAQ